MKDTRTLKNLGRMRQR